LRQRRLVQRPGPNRKNAVAQEHQIAEKISELLVEEV